jgi:ABC-type enterochelin transport system substrate-binding protein
MNSKRYPHPLLAALIILLVSLALGSCSANWHLKQAVKKGVRVTQDKWDTVIVTKERQLFDTLILKEIDSVVVRKDNIQVSLIRRFDTIRLKAICLPDTIRVTKWVKTTIKPSERPVRTWVFISICCFVLAMLFAIEGAKRR